MCERLLPESSLAWHPTDVRFLPQLHIENPLNCVIVSLFLALTAAKHGVDGARNGHGVSVGRVDIGVTCARVINEVIFRSVIVHRITRPIVLYHGSLLSAKGLRGQQINNLNETVYDETV